MIDYTPLWELMKDRNISHYALIYKYNFSNTTLARIRKGQHISTATIEQLCKILHCRVEDIVRFIEDDIQTNNEQ